MGGHQTKKKGVPKNIGKNMYVGHAPTKIMVKYALQYCRIIHLSLLFLFAQKRNVHEEQIAIIESEGCSSSAHGLLVHC